MLSLCALPLAIAGTTSPLAVPATVAGAACPAGAVTSAIAAATGLSNCPAASRPESPADLMRASTALAARSGNAAQLLPGARSTAAAQRAALAAQARSAGNDGTWQQAGTGPLLADDTRYTRVNGEGLQDIAGRINDYAYDPVDRHLFASTGEGGVWRSDNTGRSWFPIGDTLPTQAIGGIGWSSAQGGTLIVTTGNDVFGGGTTFSGLGVYRSLDLGQTWTKAGDANGAGSGVPDDIISFKIAVDPTNPNIVYAATGAGLFRSIDDAQTFQNVSLPVSGASPVAGKPFCNGAPTTREGCYLANMVTDVVVRAPGGVGSDKSGGEVIAAVGWRAGAKNNVSAAYPGGYTEAPGNGLYLSTTGAPGSFNKLGTATATFETNDQATLGRIEMGEAVGPTQDHSYLYAVVQDATAFQGGSEDFGIDIGGTNAVPTNTYLRGIYSSSDFGTTWSRMANEAQLAQFASGTALTGLACEGPSFYCPGVQAWYNEWIKPDPTRATAAGAPTRLVFGLEEVWENDTADSPEPVAASGPMSFKVIGPYFSGNTCLFLNASAPACPTTARGMGGGSTTHPDQHGGLWIPDPGGDNGVTLVVGNDGGAYTQRTVGTDALVVTGWGRGANIGPNTLMPYSAVVAKDGTIWAGLQDNGELRIDPIDKRQFMTYGGDGTYSQVDPNDSKVAYERTPGGVLNKTSDGGVTWAAAGPTDTFAFVNPFAMDPADAGHLFDAGHKVWESDGGTFGTTAVFDLGTAPGGAAHVQTAIDVKGAPAGTLPSGPHTPNLAYTGGSGTVPGGAPGTTGQDVPGTYEDHPFTIGPKDGDASATISISWPTTQFDWDLYVYKVVNGSMVLAGSSPTSADPETVTLSNPSPGNYVIRVENFSAASTFDATATFAQRAPGAALTTDAAYVAFCGTCDALILRPFDNGIATNVGGAKPGARLSTDGWHFAKAAGLPKRYITGIASDPSDPYTVYATLGGYSRRWERVGALGEGGNPGTGHVFKSIDAGEHFTDISGDLIDVPAESLAILGGKLIVGTDLGLFIAGGTQGGHYELLGNGLPPAPALSVVVKPKASPTEADRLVVATHGRGVYTYDFPGPRVTNPIPTTFFAPLPNTAASMLRIPAAPALAGMAALGLVLLVALGVAWRRRNTLNIS